MPDLDNRTHLVDAGFLAARLHDPGWRIVDCRFDLGDTEYGTRVYHAGHIPTACYAHLDHDLSGAKTGQSGRHPLPDAEAFAARLRAWGIDAATRVVAYDDSGGVFAARLWWLMRWLGHTAVAVLDGGWQAWCAGGYPQERQTPQPTPGGFRAHPRRAMWADTDAVAALRTRADHRLVDVRAAERFAGKVETIDPVAGHIPGAINLPFQRNLGPDGRFLPATALRATYREALGEVPGERVVCMCGSGVTACHTLLALAQAGLNGARLYPGSWSEWIRDPARPTAK